jgi:hypothetical protein
MILHEDFLERDRRSIDKTRFGEIMAFREHVTRRFADCVSFEFLPMLFVHASGPELQSVARLPRFKGAVAQQVAVEDYFPILRGINALQSETFHQVYEWYNLLDSGGTLPNERYVGGIWPAGPYPQAIASRTGSGDRQSHCSAPPAWMPVLNFSVGPRFSDSPVNPVWFALQSTAFDHLVVVAAGNDGALNGRTSVNTWAPAWALVVGATADEGGHQLADYSSRGVPGSKEGHPDVVAYGESSLGRSRGTSFAAPRVANVGCLAAAALLQIGRLLDLHHGRDVGIPLVGWGMIDTTEVLALPSRDGSGALPFGGVLEDPLIDAFRAVENAGGKFYPHVNGPLLRSMVLRSARAMPRYDQHEVGAGFVSAAGFLDWLASRTAGELLEPLVEPVGILESVPTSIRSARVLDRAALDELFETVKRSRPVWMFDYPSETFCVNRTAGEGALSLPRTGRGTIHAIQVAASA